MRVNLAMKGLVGLKRPDAPDVIGVSFEADLGDDYRAGGVRHDGFAVRGGENYFAVINISKIGK